jgi:hypothetical protein
MPSEFQERLSLVRNHYIDAFLSAVSEADEAEVVFEPVLRNSNGEAVGDGPLNLPCRVDVFQTTDGQSRMIDSPGAPKLPDLIVSANGVGVTLRPFIWDYARVTVKHVDSPLPIDELKDWFDDWFDVDEEEPLLDNGLAGCIHFMSDPDKSDDQTQFTIDFGTAPEKAFATLIDCFKNIPGCHVEVTSLAAEPA